MNLLGGKKRLMFSLKWSTAGAFAAEINKHPTLSIWKAPTGISLLSRTVTCSVTQCFLKLSRKALRDIKLQVHQTVGSPQLFCFTVVFKVLTG